MLLILWRAGYVTLEPEPPKKRRSDRPPPPPARALPAAALFERGDHAARRSPSLRPQPPPYKPTLAHPTPELPKLLLFAERQPAVRHVPDQSAGHRQPRGADPGDRERAGVAAIGRPFRPRAAAERLAARPAGHHPARRAVAAAGPGHCRRAERGRPGRAGGRPAAAHFDEDRVFVLTLADKLRRLFDYDFRGVQDLARIPSGRPASCWSSAATSTSTSPARVCRSRKA